MFVSESSAITLRINLKMKLSGLYSSLFVIRFSLIFYLKNLVVGGNRKEPVHFPKTLKITNLGPLESRKFTQRLFHRTFVHKTCTLKLPRDTLVGKT